MVGGRLSVSTTCTLEMSDHQNSEMDLGIVETLRLLSRNEPGVLLYSLVWGYTECSDVEHGS